ncbi:MAG: alpha/beta fold hydrolase [Gammaproteobacteria bacterium]
MVLIHGLFMSGWVMGCLARRVRGCGFRTAIFSYPSRGRSPVDNAADLAGFLARLRASRIHLVAHSLGGLVVLHLLQDIPEPRLGRILLLGTPLAGSTLVRRLLRHRPGRWLLGRSVERGLLGDRPRAAPGLDVMVIVGRRSMGIGCLFGGLPVPNDGTVTVAETRAPDCPRRVIVPTTHMGLVLSRRVARQVCGFLRGDLVQEAAAGDDGSAVSPSSSAPKGP